MEFFTPVCFLLRLAALIFFHLWGTGGKWLSKGWMALRAEIKFNPYLLLFFGSFAAFIVTLIVITISLYTLVTEFQKSLDAILWHGTVRSLGVEALRLWIPPWLQWRNMDPTPMLQDAPDPPIGGQSWLGAVPISLSALCVVGAQMRRR